MIAKYSKTEPPKMKNITKAIMMAFLVTRISCAGLFLLPYAIFEKTTDVISAPWRLAGYPVWPKVQFILIRDEDNRCYEIRTYKFKIKDASNKWPSVNYKANYDRFQSACDEFASSFKENTIEVLKQVGSCGHCLKYKIKYAKKKSGDGKNAILVESMSFRRVGFYLMENWQWRGSEYRKGIDDASCKCAFGIQTVLKSGMSHSNTSKDDSKIEFAQ